MTTRFDSLPFDVIDYIMNCDCISHIDVCRLASVSNIFNCIAKSNKLWKNKYLNTWPEFKDLFDAHETDWKLEFRMRLNYRKLVFKKLSELSAEFYCQENVSNDAFLYFKDIVRNHPLGYDIMINELENIIDHPDSHLNLTRKYYAQRALRYMRHVQLETLWRNYLSQPQDKLSLVEGACLLSQWCQPTAIKCTSQVATELESIAKLALEKVKELFTQHPVIKNGLLKDDLLSTSLWSSRHCKDILYCINHVMYEDLKFNGIPSVHHSYSAETTFIDKVLIKRSGIGITIGIIYKAVAAKLGVACLPVNFPGHFLLKWLEHPGIEEIEAYTFIDVTGSGAFHRYSELSTIAPFYDNFTTSWTQSAATVNVFIRIAWYLVEFGRQRDGEDSLALCNALELLCLLSPDDMEHKLLLARLFMHLGINVSEGISMLQDIAARDPTSQLIVGYMYQSTLQTLETQRIGRQSVKIKPKHRDESNREVKFAVGMIMKHRKYNFRCVIYGWDYTCTASKDWIKRMGVYNLIYKDKQPFYYVLVDDGTNRYAAQENLEIDKENKPINHVKIGRYFESYHGSYFLPNEQSCLEYPEDIEAREKAFQLVEGGMT